MKFTQIQTEVAERMNLTSATAVARIGRSINEGIREIVSSIGLDSALLKEAEASTVIGSRLVTFTGVTKLLSVFDPTIEPPNTPTLSEFTVDQMRNQPISTEPPQGYAIYNQTANTITLMLDCVPTVVSVLKADALGESLDIAGAAMPHFNENFHNALIYFAMGIEADKMEKPNLAKKYENKYLIRVSDLRMSIAESNYLQIRQAQNVGRTLGTFQVPLV